MKIPNRRLGFARLITISTVVLGAVALLSLTARAQPMGDNTPVRIAVVNIDAVIFQLDEYKDRMDELKAKVQTRQADLDKLSQRIEQIETDLRERELDNDQQLQLLVERAELKGQLDGRGQALQKVTEIEQNRIVGDVYQKMTARVEQIAGNDSIDLVLVDDAHTNAVSIPARRVLFASARLDISERVRNDMNAAYKAGQ